jgi:hypothetical protein
MALGKRAGCPDPKAQDPNAYFANDPHKQTRTTRAKTSSPGRSARGQTSRAQRAPGIYLPFSRMANKTFCPCGSMANCWLFKT